MKRNIYLLLLFLPPIVGGYLVGYFKYQINQSMVFGLLGYIAVITTLRNIYVGNSILQLHVFNFRAKWVRLKKRYLNP